MEKSLAGYLSVITDVVLVSFEPLSPHNSQRIDGNQQHNEDNTYYHILTHAHTTKHHQTPPNTTKHKHITNTTKHNTHFQDRYRPTSFQVERGLHRSTWTNDFCMVRTVSPNRECPKSGTLALRQVRAVCRQRERALPDE